MGEDTKISREHLQATFQRFVDDFRQRIEHYEAALKESHDHQGKPHKPWVEAVVANIKQHLDEAELFMRSGERKL